MSRVLSWLWVAGSLALVFAVVGFLLPARRMVERSARYKRPVRELWSTTTDFTGHAGWRKAIDRVHALPDRNGHPAYRELGPSFERTYEVVSIVAPRRLELAVDDRWFAGTWTFDFAVDGEGTRLSITESGEADNVFLRVAQHVFVDRADELELFLVELGRLFLEDVKPLAPPPEPVQPMSLGI